MSRRKVAPWLLAASVFLTGSASLLMGSITPAQAITSVEELRDVDSSSWAYQALSDLVEKYDVIEGYPDYTFKGKRPATRYEMAAALNALIKSVGRDLARLGAEKANKADLATLARLQDEFRNELAALNAKEAALESRASAIEAKNAEQDTRLDLLERTQIHGDFSIGALYDVNGNGEGPAGAHNGIRDGVSTLGRLRLGVKVPVVPGYDNSPIGEGDVIARLVGAFGRFAPDGSNNASVVNANPISGYSAIAGNQSSFNEGIGSGSLNSGVTSGINLRQNLYVESAYYKQHFRPGIPVLTSGIPGLFPNKDTFRTSADLYMGIIPWRNLFDRSPYKGDELNQFQNTALVNNVGLLANNINPTLALSIHQGLGDHFSMDVTGAASTLDENNFANGIEITEELNLNYDTWFLGRTFTKPGTVFVGGYEIMFDGNSNPSSMLNAFGTVLENRNGTPLSFRDHGDQGVNALYVGMNQEFWRGIGGSVDWVMNSTNSNNALLTFLHNGYGINSGNNSIAAIDNIFTGTRIVGINSALSAVATIPLTVFNKGFANRSNDAIGLGYSYIDPTNNGDGDHGTNVGFRNGYEHVFEAFYRWAWNKSFTVVPSAQVIMNAAGVKENGCDVVFGLRTNYVF